VRVYFQEADGIGDPEDAAVAHQCRPPCLPFHAFTALNLSNLVAFTRHDNIASRRLMEKVGFLYERDFIDEGVPSVLYRSVRIPSRSATSPRQAVSGNTAEHSRTRLFAPYPPRGLPLTRRVLMDLERVARLRSSRRAGPGSGAPGRSRAPQHCAVCRSLALRPRPVRAGYGRGG
jgi:hypothetical protein